MKKPTKKEIKSFLKENFPHIEFDGIKYEESKLNQCWFKVFSFGRMIGQADHELNDKYWENVKRHLSWCFK